MTSLLLLLLLLFFQRPLNTQSVHRTMKQVYMYKYTPHFGIARLYRDLCAVYAHAQMCTCDLSQESTTEVANNESRTIEKLRRRGNQQAHETDVKIIHTKKKTYEPYSALVEYSSANATVRQDIYISPNRECILPPSTFIFPAFAMCTLVF
jgi:hypothetical protein